MPEEVFAKMTVEERKKLPATAKDFHLAFEHYCNSIANSLKPPPKYEFKLRTLDNKPALKLVF